MKVEWNQKFYCVDENETFEKKPENLERYAAFLKKLNCNRTFDTLLLSHPHLGGFLGIELSPFYDNIFILNSSTIPQVAALEENKNIHHVSNVHRSSGTDVDFFHVFVDLTGRCPPGSNNCVYLSPEQWWAPNMQEYFWEKENTYVYLPRSWCPGFEAIFPCTDNSVLFDNLVEVCMIVKNGGDLFKDMILHNAHLVDHWTIVDTGSTDTTVQVIEKELIDQKQGTLFFCHFENFEQARNYALDCCQGFYKFTMVLDDSYKIHGNFRETLEALCTQNDTSCYSYYVHRADTHFLSCRIFPSYQKLRFQGKILEELNISTDSIERIPQEHFYIEDSLDEESIQRTLERHKHFEIPMLEKNLQDQPHNDKIMFQLGELNRFLQNWGKAIQYYEKRLPIKYKGSLIERWNCAFELGRIHHNHEKSGLDVFEKYYQLAKQIDPSRPESDFMLGIYYFEINEWNKAFSYFKVAFDIGIPGPSFFKPTMYYFYIPHYVLRLALHFRDSLYAIRASQLLEQHKSIIQQWHLEKHLYVPIYLFPQLHVILNQWLVPIYRPNLCKKPIVCFIVPFGWTSWTGKDLHQKGIGGSETFIIQLAETMANSKQYDLRIFCECSTIVSHHNVTYSPLPTFAEFAREHYIQYCIINRSVAYSSLAMLAPNVENVYLILHDFVTHFDHFHDGFKLKTIFCVSKELQQHVTPHIPCPTKLRILQPAVPSSLLKIQEKVPMRFHYSSTPDRGLYVLLKMWPDIYRLSHDVSLHVYSDLDNPFSLSRAQNEITWIKEHQDELHAYHVVFHGFVGKNVLYDAWGKADIWLYPCTFQETFCMTALEAAASRTLVVSSGDCGLASSIGNRGIIIPGDPRTLNWMENALSVIQGIFSGNIDRNDYVQRNFDWAESMTWEVREQHFRNVLQTDSISFFSSQSMITHKDRNVLQSLIHGSPGHTSILLLEDEMGVMADYFFREVNGCRLTIVNEGSPSCFFEYNAKRWIDHTILKNAPLNALIQLIKKSHKFDIIYVNQMPKQNVILNNAMFLLQSGGILLVEKQGENSIDLFGVQKHFENEDFAIYSKTHISPPSWKPSESFLFSRDVQWEKLLAKYLTSLHKDVVEIGVGNSSLYCFNANKKIISFMRDSPFVESFRNFAEHQGFHPTIHTAPPIHIKSPCILIINNLLLAEDIDDFSQVENILIRNNVSSFHQKLEWEKKLEKQGFVLEYCLHSEHNICPFRYVEHWERHDKSFRH
ncbi:MAG: hypothetical protein CMM15_10395 [Rhodospirillaceae bacterium]|nr:hypothetical protein [Rhodospirillaceae bacterium]OUX67976.1 MAG: hypothetical protein CBD38_00730 [bacterium TMED178]